MRTVVRDKLRAGDTPDQIKAYFVSKHGEWILLEPKMTRLNIALMGDTCVIACRLFLMLRIQQSAYTTQ